MILLSCEGIAAKKFYSIERIDDGYIVTEPIFDGHLAADSVLGPADMPSGILASQIGYIPIVFVLSDIIHAAVPVIQITDIVAFVGPGPFPVHIGSIGDLDLDGPISEGQIIKGTQGTGSCHLLFHLLLELSNMGLLDEGVPECAFLCQSTSPCFSSHGL
jgi:hypothetical protein